MELQDSSLFHTQAYIGGKWVDADNGKTIDVLNPANGELLGTVPLMGRAETERAIAAIWCELLKIESIGIQDNSKLLLLYLNLTSLLSYHQHRYKQLNTFT